MESKDYDIVKFLAEETGKDAKEARIVAVKSLNLSKEQEMKLTVLIDSYNEIKSNILESDKRLSNLEKETEAQETVIDTLLKEQETANDALSDIQKTMMQIKWAVFGALGMFLIEAMGLQEVLKKLLL